MRAHQWLTWMGLMGCRGKLGHRGFFDAVSPQQQAHKIAGKQQHHGLNQRCRHGFPIRVSLPNTPTEDRNVALNKPTITIRQRRVAAYLYHIAQEIYRPLIDR